MEPGLGAVFKIFMPTGAHILCPHSIYCSYKFLGKRKQDRGETYPNALTQGKTITKNAHLSRKGHPLLEVSGRIGLYTSQPQKSIK